MKLQRREINTFWQSIPHINNAFTLQRLDFEFELKAKA